MREGRAESGIRFPDRVVQIGRTFTDGAVKLGGDEARLLPHEGSIILPCLKEGWLVRWGEREHVHQHDGTGVDRDLAFDREGGSRGRNNGMTISVQFGNMMSI